MIQRAERKTIVSTFWVLSLVRVILRLTSNYSTGAKGQVLVRGSVQSASLKGQCIFPPYYTHTHTHTHTHTQSTLVLSPFRTFPEFLQQVVCTHKTAPEYKLLCNILQLFPAHTASPHPSKIQISIKFFTLPSTLLSIEAPPGNLTLPIFSPYCN